MTSPQNTPENNTVSNNEALKNAPEQKVQQKSKESIDQLKKELEISSDIMKPEQVKRGLNYIDNIDAKINRQDRRMLLDILLGKLSQDGYQITFFDGRNAKVWCDAKAPYKAEIEALFSSFIQGEAANRDDLKTAILYRTKSVDNFMQSNLSGEMQYSGSDYQGFLLNKYGFKSEPSADRIMKRDDIPLEDRIYMVSCKQNEYLSGYSLQEPLTSLAAQKQANPEIYQQFREYFGAPNTKQGAIIKEDKKNIPTPPNTASNTGNKNTGEVANQPNKGNNKNGGTDEISEYFNKVGIAGTVGTIGGFFYMLFNKPKLLFGGLLIFGAYKAGYLPEETFKEIANEFLDERKNDKKDLFNGWKPDTSVKVDGKTLNVAPSKIENQRASLRSGAEQANDNDFNAVYSGLLNSVEFRNMDIAKLREAQSKKSLGGLFANIKDIGGMPGSEFYKKYNNVIGKDKKPLTLVDIFVAKLLAGAEPNDKSVRDLFVEGQMPIGEEEKGKIEVVRMREAGLTELMVLSRMFELGYVPEFKEGAKPQAGKIGSWTWIKAAASGTEDMAWKGLNLLALPQKKFSEWLSQDRVRNLVSDIARNEVQASEDLLRSGNIGEQGAAHLQARIDAAGKIVLEATNGSISPEVFESYMRVAEKMPRFGLLLDAQNAYAKRAASIATEVAKTQNLNLDAVAEALRQEEKARLNEIFALLDKEGADPAEIERKINEFDEFVQKKVMDDVILSNARKIEAQKQVETFIVEEKLSITGEKEALDRAKAEGTITDTQYTDALDTVKAREAQLADIELNAKNMYADGGFGDIKTFEDVKNSYNKIEARPEFINMQEVYWDGFIADEKVKIAQMQTEMVSYTGADKNILESSLAIQQANIGRLEQLKNSDGVNSDRFFEVKNLYYSQDVELKIQYESAFGAGMYEGTKKDIVTKYWTTFIQNQKDRNPEYKAVLDDARMTTREGLIAQMESTFVDKGEKSPEFLFAREQYEKFNTILASDSKYSPLVEADIATNAVLLEAMNEVVSQKWGVQQNMENKLSAYKTQLETDAKLHPETIGTYREMAEAAEVERISAEMEKLNLEVENISEELQRASQEINTKVEAGEMTKEEGMAKLNEAIAEANTRQAPINEAVAENLVNAPNSVVEQVHERSFLVQKLAGVNDGLGKMLEGTVGRRLFKGMIYTSIALNVNAAREGEKSWKEAGWDAADMLAGFIPGYDLYRVSQGTDLNGREMTDSEKAMRTGFGVLSFVPFVGWGGKLLGKGVIMAAKEGNMISKTIGVEKAATLANGTVRTIDGAVEVVRTVNQVGMCGALAVGIYATGSEVLRLASSTHKVVTKPTAPAVPK